MHEMGIASSVLDAVRTEAELHPGSRVSKVGLRIGELAGIDPESLRFCFEALVKDSSLGPLPLEIEFCPRMQHCPTCGCTFKVADYDTTCAFCGLSPTDCVGGTELELSYLEMEEP
jgi:hydrogenase nickel incorporation protein HypA/HybF